MKDPCAKQEVAVADLQEKVNGLKADVADSTGQQKQGFARLLFLARKELATAQRTLAGCLLHQ